MKKITALLLTAVCALSLVACGGGSSNSGSDNKNQDSGKGYVFSANGTEIAVDADVKPVVDKLGDPISYFEAASCAFDGLDKTYTYDGYTIETYPSDDKDCVSSITLNDDTVKTPEGIALGASADDVKSAYGEATESNGSLVYEKGGMKLTFVIKDGKVTSIQYSTTVLD